MYHSAYYTVLSYLCLDLCLSDSVTNKTANGSPFRLYIGYICIGYNVNIMSSVCAACGS